MSPPLASLPIYSFSTQATACMEAAYYNRNKHFYAEIFNNFHFYAKKLPIPNISQGGAQGFAACCQRVFHGLFKISKRSWLAKRKGVILAVQVCSQSPGIFLLGKDRDSNAE